MKLAIKLGCAAVISTLAFASSAMAQDRSQLIAAAGISATQAQSLTLGQIAAYKFNRSAGMDSLQSIPMSTREITVDPARHAQLIHAAGLTPEQARGMTIGDLAVAKYNLRASSDERQTRANMFPRDPDAAVAPSFVRASGLTPQAARGLSLNDVYVSKRANESMGNYDQ